MAASVSPFVEIDIMPVVEVIVIGIGFDEIRPVACHGHGFIAKDPLDLFTCLIGKIGVCDLRHDLCAQARPRPWNEGEYKTVSLPAIVFSLFSYMMICRTKIQQMR